MISSVQMASIPLGLGSKRQRGLWGRLAASAAVFGALLFGFPSIGNALLLNGDFELNSPTGFNTAPPHNLPDWQVNGTVDFGTGPAQTTCQAGPSSHCVDLNGSSPGEISQKFELCTPTYRVTFYMSRHFQLAGSSATLQATVTSASSGAVLKQVPFTHGPGALTHTGNWQMKQFDFQGPGPFVLSFKSMMPGQAGPQVDNVRVAFLTCQ